MCKDLLYEDNWEYCISLRVSSVRLSSLLAPFLLTDKRYCPVSHTFFFTFFLVSLYQGTVKNSKYQKVTNDDNDDDATDKKTKSYYLLSIYHMTLSHQLLTSVFFPNPTLMVRKLRLRLVQVSQVFGVRI